MHPAVIALLLSSFIISCMMLYSTYFGLQIVRKWDIKSGSEVQLNLERRTYLVSTLVQYALLFEVISIFLFIYTAEDIHTLLVGAMCATGSLNANPFGFPALYAKIAVFFAAASWIAVNHIDNKAEDYPLIK
ncbi:MAG: hypothetical protein IVZ94_03405, partial [Nitrospirae bacterium]|nr:hypothetical protein [Nitrospirota bacterium]